MQSGFVSIVDRLDETERRCDRMGLSTVWTSMDHAKQQAEDQTKLEIQELMRAELSRRPDSGYLLLYKPQEVALFSRRIVEWLDRIGFDVFTAYDPRQAADYCTGSVTINMACVVSWGDFVTIGDKATRQTRVHPVDSIVAHKLGSQSGRFSFGIILHDRLPAPINESHSERLERLHRLILEAPQQN